MRRAALTLSGFVTLPSEATGWRLGIIERIPGSGFKPIILEYIAKMSSEALFWVNMVSATLDNATLAAAEIGPTFTALQIKAALMGLLIAGGMLIREIYPILSLQGNSESQAVRAEDLIPVKAVPFYGGTSPPFSDFKV